MIVITVLLLGPLLLALQCFWNRRDSTFCQMLLGYTACNFMKSFHSLLNRLINGDGIDGLAMNCIAILAAFFFLAAIESLFRHMSAEGGVQQGNGQHGARGKRWHLWVICGLVFLLAEGVFNALELNSIVVSTRVVSLVLAYVIVLRCPGYVLDMEEEK